MDCPKTCRLHLGLVLLGLAIFGGGSTAPAALAFSQEDSPALRALGEQTLRFVPNRERAASEVDFAAISDRSSVFLAAGRATVVMGRPSSSPTESGLGSDRLVHGTILKIALAEADPKPQAVGLRPLPEKVSSFLGSEEDQWQPFQPAFASVRYREIYPGVDVVYSGQQGSLRFDFLVSPEADPAQIALDVEHADSVTKLGGGDLLIRVGQESLRLKRPRLYQEVNGIRRSIDGEFALATNDRVRIRVGDYDTSRPLIIDPTLIYAERIGGGGAEAGLALAVDRQGYTHVAGWTAADMLHGEYRREGPAVPDADLLVKVLTPQGAVVRTTYLGGSGDDWVEGIDVDEDGFVYLTGTTESADFPIVNALQPRPGGGSDAFLVKLPPSGGRPVFSTFLGGAGDDVGTGVAVGPDGQVHVGGRFGEESIPAFDSAKLFGPGGSDDAFLLGLDRDGTRVLYSAFLGGSGAERAEALAVGRSGLVYLAGWTTSSDFPMESPLQPVSGGGEDGFFAVLDSGRRLSTSSYLGGDGADGVEGMGLGPDGAVFLTGFTESSDFPALKPGGVGGSDAFLVKLAPGFDRLELAQRLGGADFDSGQAVAVDRRGRAHVVGVTASRDFPTEEGFQTSLKGSADGFYTQFARSGDRLESTYLGGAGDDAALQVVAMADGGILLTGQTRSPEFPSSPRKLAGPSDAFVARLIPGRTETLTRMSAGAQSALSPQLQKAEAAWEKGAWEEATRLYEAIAQEEAGAEAAQAQLRLATYHSFVSEPAEALRMFDELLRRKPRSRIAHEARTDKASLLYAQGKLDDARRLLATVASEADSWHLVKYATSRLKDLDRIHNTDHRHGERLAQCGVQAVTRALVAQGLEARPGELVSRLSNEQAFVSMAELADAAARYGVEPVGIRATGEAFDRLRPPFVAHLRTGHFVTVLSANGRSVEVFDPGRGTFTWTREQFRRDWTGRALLLPESGGPEPERLAAVRLLSRSELREVRGGHHLHGNNLGGSGSNGATPYDRGPSPPSPCDSVGLPSLSVNLATFNLVVEDTEFRYGGLGPDIFLRRTYNADDPTVGAFGRSWRFNYEVTIEETPNGSVNLKRGSGKEDFFALLGCTDGVCTYEPPLWSRDELTKNPDGTWDLELRRSRMTQHFDTDGRLEDIVDRNGNTVTVGYDADGALTTVTDAAGRVTTFTYGAHGYVTSVVDPAGRQATYGYDSVGNLVSQTDMVGNVISYAYDDNSYMTSLSTPTGTWEIENVPYADADFGQVVASITDPLGHSTSYSTPGFTVVEVEDANGNVWSYFPTGDGEVPEMIDPLGNRTELTFNSFGERTSITNANGNVFQIDYDAAGNVTSLVDGAEQNLDLTYDARNNLVGAEDSLGHQYSYQYDERGNLVEIRDPAGGVTNYEYDPNGLLTAVSDALGNRTTFSYSANGDLTVVTTPLGHSTEILYDEVGRTVELTTPENETFTFTYDGIDRPIRIELPDNRAYTYSYNCCRLTGIAGNQESIAFSFDAGNRLTGYTDGRGNGVAYQYDNVGNVAALSYPGGQRVSYRYDAASRMIEVEDWRGNRLSYGYDPAGRVAATRFANGFTTIYDRDPTGRLVELSNVMPSGEVHSYYRYSYDPLGRRVAVESLGPEETALASSTTTYSYDASNRIVAMNATTFSHDKNGNLILETTDGAQRSYSYDESGQMLSATDGAARVDSVYDLLGRRIATLQDGQRTELIVDPSSRFPRILTERPPESEVVRYVYGMGLIAKNVEGGGTFLFLYDGAGNVVGMSRADGSEQSSFRYRPFGGEMSGADAAGRHRFQGRHGVTAGVWEQSRTLARAYRTDLGRFMSTDPLLPAGGGNSYSYCANDPINRIDPEGLDYLHITGALGVFSYGLKVGSTGIYGETGFTAGWGTPTATWNRGSPRTGTDFARSTITSGTAQIPLFPDNFRDLRRNAKIGVGVGVSLWSGTYTFPVWEFDPDC